MKRILVVKPCCLGDVLMTTPAVRALHQHFSAAEIHYLTTAWCAAVVQSSRAIETILRYPDHPNPARLAVVARKLRRRRYDIGIGLDRSPQVNALLWFSGIPIRTGIDSHGRGVGLTRRTVPKPGQHESELYLQVVKTLGVPERGLEPEYRVPSTARDRVAEQLPRTDGPVVVIHPGGAVNPGTEMLEKRWPAVSFGSLASLLASELGATLVIVGAESDSEVVQIAKDFSNAPLLDLSRRLTLPELAAVCERADLFVGNDSGVSHLASAVGTATVTIFGPTSPQRYRPLGQNAYVCAPAASWTVEHDAEDLRARQPFDPARDIALVTVDQVFDACREALKSRPGRSPA